MKLRKAAIPAAVVATLGLGAAGSAQADSYGYSFNDIFELATIFTCTSTPNNCLGPDPGTLPGAFILQNYQASSQADANVSTVPGGIADGQVFSGPPFPVGNPDAPLQFQSSDLVAPPPTNNLWAAVGKTGNYARGDAQIVTQQVNQINPSRAINVAEGNLTELDATATANGSNTSTTGFTLTFTVTETWSVAFDFDALPFMESLITLNAATSTTDLDVSFTINDVTIPQLPETIFNWAPNGVVGDGIIGGTETADDASLNIEISDIIADASSIIYDPLNGIGSAACSGGICDYSAESDQFDAGTYSLILTMHEGIVLTNAEIVPEPTTLALAGIGLIGMGLARRRGRKTR